MKDEIEYSRHFINQEGQCQPRKKIEEVVNATSPQNKKQLRSWFGFVN